MLPFYLIAAFTSTSKLRNIYDRGTAAARRTLHTFASQPRLQNVKGTSERQRKEMQDQTNKSTEKVNWIIRPATVDDRDGCAALIQLSYQTLLARDYSDECLAKCLPLITTPREQLLTCNTWFVVEHPSTRQIVGCGGWTVRSPLAKEATKNKVAEKNSFVYRSRRTSSAFATFCNSSWLFSHGDCIYYLAKDTFGNIETIFR